MILVYVIAATLGFLFGAIVIVGGAFDPPSWRERLGFGVLWAITFFAAVVLTVGTSSTLDPTPAKTTTTTIPNTDPTKGWVYENGLHFRCEGPNMVYDGAHENAAVKDDPRCVAAFEGGAR